MVDLNTSEPPIAETSPAEEGPNPEAEPEPESEPEHEPEPRSRPRRFLFAATLLAAGLIVSIVLGEGVVRWRMSWLLPGRADYNAADGLALRPVEVKFFDIKEGEPDYVLIGDSHVETGSAPGGWVDHLSEITGKKFLNLAVAGSCPSQYFILLDRLRAEGFAMPVVMVIYIGNDFIEEGLWAELGDDKSGYLQARGDAFSDPTEPQFWPCLDEKPTLGAWLTDHSALYRALFFAKYKIASRFLTDEPATPPEETERMLTQLMEDRCDKPPHSERVGDRLFFFREHEALLDERDPRVAAGRKRIARLLRERGSEENLRIAFAVTREETSVSFTGREVTRAAGFIDEMREFCPDLIDPAQAFIDRAARDDLYLPDSHWNPAGGELFAEEIKRALGL